jgi:flagellar motor switch protein FliN
MVERKKAAKKVAKKEPVSDELEVNKIEFPKLSPASNSAPINGSMFNNIPVKVTAELGSTKISLKDIYELSEGAIIELDRHAGEPLDLLVNGQLVAQGEVVAVDSNYGLRIKNIIKNK